MPKSLTPPYLTRPRWTERDARTALAALSVSGLTVRAFASREGLDAQRLYIWRRKLGASSSIKAAARPSFIEIGPRSADRIEVVLRSGLVLRVSESVDGGALRRLIEQLEERQRC
jgi:transposase-like protein